MLDATALVSALNDSGLKLTQPRRLIADIIARHDNHFTALQIFEEARQQDPLIGRATVFRTLDLLVVLGAVERVHLPDGSDAYVVGNLAEHHHHLICSRCGKVVDFTDCSLGKQLTRVAARAGFRPDNHRLEIYGECNDCA